MGIDFSDRTVPPRALALSLAALTVPVIGAFQFPEQLGDYSALLWLTTLLPAFILAYYRAWRGIATALAVGMATLSLTQAAVLLVGRQVPDMLLGVVIAYVAISLCIGWLAESLHQERAVVEDMAFTDHLTRPAEPPPWSPLPRERVRRRRTRAGTQSPALRPRQLQEVQRQVRTRGRGRRTSRVRRHPRARNTADGSLCAFRRRGVRFSPDVDGHRRRDDLWRPHTRRALRDRTQRRQ